MMSAYDAAPATAASPGANRRCTYRVVPTADGWCVEHGRSRAGGFPNLAEAVITAERLAREACAFDGCCRLLIEHHGYVEVRTLRRARGKG